MTLAFAKPIKGGFSIEGMETVPYVTSILPAETPEGDTVFLAPETHDLVLKIDDRSDQILGLWVEKLKQFATEVLDECDRLCADLDPVEGVSARLALSHLSNEAFREVFQSFSERADGLYEACIREYQVLERETMLKDGYAKTNSRAGSFLTFLESILVRDVIPDCGDANCPIHGRHDKNTAQSQDTVEFSTQAEEALRANGTDTTAGFEDKITGVVEKGWQTNADGRLSKETSEGLLITNQTTVDLDADVAQRREDCDRQSQNAADALTDEEVKANTSKRPTSRRERTKVTG